MDDFLCPDNSIVLIVFIIEHCSYVPGTFHTLSYFGIHTSLLREDLLCPLDR